MIEDIFSPVFDSPRHPNRFLKVMNLLFANLWKTGYSKWRVINCYDLLLFFIPVVTEGVGEGVKLKTINTVVRNVISL